MKHYLHLTLCILLVGTVCCKRGADKRTEIRDQSQDVFKIGEQITLYRMPYAYDHTIIYNDHDKKWHLFGIEEGNKSFIHLTADTLTQEGWEKHAPFVYQEEEIWAPHIVNHNGLYYMFFTNIGVPREIRLATSKDLFSWEHYSEEPLFAWSNEQNVNLKNKDPMVFRDDENNQWIMYVTMMKDATHWVVGYSTSEDLVNWSDYKICFDENSESPGVESPFVFKRGDLYYLTLSARNTWPHGAQEFFISKNPFYWEVSDLVKSIDPWHAAEVIRDLDGNWYLSRSSGSEHDFRLAPIFWDDDIND